jgi:DNA-binding response OmpR family regulator
MSRVLLVEDDPTIGRALQSALAAHRYDVHWEQTVAGARTVTTGNSFDLILLDLGLPDGDGVDLCRQIRSSQPASVIVILTARDDEIDIVVGLEAGADDYITKPFRLVELLARLRAHLRRGPSSSTAPTIRRVGALAVDVAARRAWVGPRELVLRAKEFDLLARLAAEPGVAVSRDTLMSDVWDEHWHGSTKTLDVHIAALRRKLADAYVIEHETDPAPYLVTLRGRGYRLETATG